MVNYFDLSQISLGSLLIEQQDVRVRGEVCILKHCVKSTTD